MCKSSGPATSPQSRDISEIFSLLHKDRDARNVRHTSYGSSVLVIDAKSIVLFGFDEKYQGKVIVRE